MSKYIDAEKLKAEIEKLKKEARENALIASDNNNTPVCASWAGKENICMDILSIIDSLQQDQPDLPGIEDPGIPGKDYIPVEWVDACEMYGKWKIVKQEPEVDLEKEIEEHVLNMPHCEFSLDSDVYNDEEWARKEFRHFYKRGLNAREK